MLPIIPATIVNCAECTCPIPEDLSVGLMYVCANICAIGFTFMGQYLLTLDSFGVAPLFPFGVVVIATMILGLAPVSFYNGPYKRLNQDKVSLTVSRPNPHQ